MIIDLHCHYTFLHRPLDPAGRFSFEPPGRRGGPDACDSCVSPRALERVAFRLMRRVMNMPNDPAEVDQRLEAFYDRHLGGAGPVQRWVLLAFDAYHDDHGRRPPLPFVDDDLGSDIYTSNSLVRATCRAHADRYLFGASVHPYRENALACIDEVFAAGAVLIKLMPLHQNIALDDPRTLAYFRHCASIGLPLLLHFGPEFTLRTQHPPFGELTAMLEVLNRLRRTGDMPITIIAHVATPVSPLGPWRHYHTLVDALRGPFADAPLFADISACNSWGKVWFLRRIARQQELHHKLLFGSDFPVAPATTWLRYRLGEHFAPIARLESWSQQAAETARIIGFNEIVLRRAAALLPNVGAFAAET